jgi:hypothetical protein
MPRHVHQIDTPLSAEEARFAATLARGKSPRDAAIAAGYPRQSAGRIGEMLSQSLDIRGAVLALVRRKDRSALVARWEAEDDAAFAEHVRGNLPVLIQHTRERLAATKLPPAGELVIQRRTTRAERRSAAAAQGATQ